MLTEFIEILNNMQIDMAKRFENADILDDIQESVKVNLEGVVDYFVKCLQQSDECINY